jgi:diguanylate cyclase (GGDEF)-like protein
MPMNRLLAKQLERARDAEGRVDLDRLAALVQATYEDFARDQRRVERASTLMAEELSDAAARLEAAADALRLQNRRFEAALDNMSQGLCLVGANGRIVVSNERLSRMLGLPPPQALSDRPLEDVLAQATATIAAPEESARVAAAYRALSARASRAVTDLALPGGRVVLVAHEPLADGGFVQTFEDVTARQLAEAKIVHLATHDVLTDLPNRRLFQQRLEAALGTSGERRPCAVLCLDLDRFKPVNDALGHAAGDQLLLQVTERLRRQVRGSDTVARLGGDEFAVLMVGGDRFETVDAFARRLVDAIAEPYDLGGNTVVIGTTVGIALAPRDGSDPHRLIRCADLALYAAKREGRGQHRFFEASMDADAQARHALETDLRRALAAGEFELHYQPVVSLDAGAACGFEALLRWNSPTRGRVAPDAFVPLAEELGLIVPIGDWVLHDACRTASGWPGDLTIAVNVSAWQFKSGSLVRSVTDALEASGLPARRLELEITESVLLGDDGVALETLHRLRALGVRIVMDDFGTGYSSLAYLRSFPFDKIKIDRSFVDGLGRQSDAMAIVRAVTGLCNGLGIPSTAEGVETPEQLRLLGIEQCTQVQGYLFSRPRPASEVPAMLAEVTASAGRTPRADATARTRSGEGATRPRADAVTGG